MAKYIDADALKKKLKKDYGDVHKTIPISDFVTFLTISYIDNMPAVDVEPVRKWIKASEKKPVFPCITVDGWGNYPKIATGICALTKENGETLYFTDDLIREKAFMLDGEWTQPLLDKPNNIAYWMPLPKSPKMDGGSEE